MPIYDIGLPTWRMLCPETSACVPPQSLLRTRHLAAKSKHTASERARRVTAVTAVEDEFPDRNVIVPFRGPRSSLPRIPAREIWPRMIFEGVR